MFVIFGVPSNMFQLLMIAYSYPCRVSLVAHRLSGDETCKMGSLASCYAVMRENHDHFEHHYRLFVNTPMLMPFGNVVLLA